MVPVSFLYDDMCRNNNECRVFFVHDCTWMWGRGKSSDHPITKAKKNIEQSNFINIQGSVYKRFWHVLLKINKTQMDILKAVITIFFELIM